VVKEPDEGDFSFGCTRVEAPEEAGRSPGTDRERHPGCLDAMFAALSTGTKPETDCTDNLHSMEMVFGAIRSARERRRIEL
jgi:predicted dehydrogenase